MLFGKEQTIQIINERTGIPKSRCASIWNDLPKTTKFSVRPKTKAADIERFIEKLELKTLPLERREILWSDYGS